MAKKLALAKNLALMRQVQAIHNLGLLALYFFVL